MPLSEEELRLLEQMERALAEEDPKFVSALRGRTLERTARMRALAALVVFVAGLAMLVGAMLVGGKTTLSIALAIAGFVVMVASATFGLTAWRGRHAPAERSPAADAFDEAEPGRPFEVIDGGKRERRPRRPRNQGSFMQRMEQRWHHRRDSGF